ncbi:MAG: hypothetical protein KDK45_17535 [Leptospiraceae bacterium]|nr:hypothetical protein [Leptospiraceae bacterium]
MEEEQMDIDYKTWNNELSDLNAKSMIALNSKVYKELAELSKGDTVIFSGKFIRDNKRGFEQSNMLESSVVRDPEFIIRFTAIKKKN